MVRYLTLIIGLVCGFGMAIVITALIYLCSLPASKACRPKRVFLRRVWGVFLNMSSGLGPKAEAEAQANVKEAFDVVARCQLDSHEPLSDVVQRLWDGELSLRGELEQVGAKK